MGLVKLAKLTVHTNHLASEVRLNRSEPGAVALFPWATGLARQIPTISQEQQV